MPERPQQSYFGKIALIAWREFRHTALTKGFIFGAIAVPVLMFGVIALIPQLISKQSPPLKGTIVHRAGAGDPRSSRRQGRGAQGALREPALGCHGAD